MSELENFGWSDNWCTENNMARFQGEEFMVGDHLDAVLQAINEDFFELDAVFISDWIPTSQRFQRKLLSSHLHVDFAIKFLCLSQV